MSNETRRARKQHRCEHCGEPIPVGRLYTYARITPWSHPDNESFGHYRAHLRCDALWSEVGADSDWTFWDSRREWLRALRAQAENYFAGLLPGPEMPLLPEHPDGCECLPFWWPSGKRLTVDRGPSLAVVAMRERATA